MIQNTTTGLRRYEVIDYISVRKLGEKYQIGVSFHSNISVKPQLSSLTHISHQTRSLFCPLKNFNGERMTCTAC